MRLISRLHSKGLLSRNKRFIPVYAAAFLVSLHYALVIYVNSSYLGTFFSSFETAVLFGLGATLFLITLLSAESILSTFPVSRLFIGTIIAEVAAVWLLMGSFSPSLVAVGFILHQGALGFLVYLLDIFLEREIRDEGTTGEKRGIFLTFSNLAFVFAPVFAGFMIDRAGFSSLYTVSLVIILLLLPFHWSSRIRAHTIPRPHHKLSPDLRLGTFLSFLLQFFYGWMVVWSPIYLISVMGFSWSIVGVMFSIALLPFILFELPLGELADHMFGEKEIIAIGFFISALALISISAIHVASFVGLTLALFMTRTGAAAIEVGSESYFFKHVSGHDAGTIGLFRTMRPISMMVAPLAGALAIYAVGFRSSFIILAAIMAAGSFVALRLKDTK